MKVLFDTNVLISTIGRAKHDEDNSRFYYSNFVIAKCDKLKLEKCISERTIREFEKGWKSGRFSQEQMKKEKLILDKFVTLGYHSGNEFWEEIDGTWDNWYTKWGDKGESKIADEIKKDLKNDRHKHDRGILLDAIQNDCEIIVSENWSDFGKIYNIGLKYGVTICTLENFEEVFK